MKYHILAKIVGLYLPDEYVIGDISLKKEIWTDLPNYPNLPIRNLSSDEHLISKGVECRIHYPQDKINLRSFSSSHLIRVIIEDRSLYWAKNRAIARIDHFVDALNLALFSKERIRGDKIIDRGINDLYQYEVVGVYIETENGLQKLAPQFPVSGMNVFPEVMEDDFKDVAKDILRCNNEVVMKALKYLKRAREFSFEHFSEMEVLLNSVKCIELICMDFYPDGAKGKKLTKKGKEYEGKMSFRDRLDGTLDKPGIVSLLGIDTKYRDFADSAWKNRSGYDYAHATVHDKSIPPIFSHKVNEVAYHFLFKYILYLKKEKPECFFQEEVLLDDEWWKLFGG